MKKISKISIAASLVLVIAVAVFTNAETPQKDGGVVVETEPIQRSPYDIVPPAIPKNVVFAGEEIDLTQQDRRERMDREMLSFCYSHINTTLQLKRANRLFPIVEPVLRECGVPDDFKYLMIIESNGDIEARSPTGASGLWQFMEATGKEYGLEINGEVDERYNIEKATRAACRYLKESYREFGDWLTVAASYNTGRANVKKRIDAQNQTKAIDLVLLPETSRYIFRLLAVKTIFEKPSDYGFILQSSDLYPTIPTNSVAVDSSIVSWAVFAQQYGLTYLQLREINPWIRGKALTNRSGKNYSVLIPESGALNYNPDNTTAHNGNWVTK